MSTDLDLVGEDDLADQQPTEAGPAATAPSSEQEPAPELCYPNVYVFVQEFLARIYARPVRAGSSWHWCATWFEHPEAVSRLEALWSAFETLRLDPGLGPATWWRDFADPTMTALSDPSGPFARCSATEHHLPPELPVDSPATWLLQR